MRGRREGAGLDHGRPPVGEAPARGEGDGSLRWARGKHTGARGELEGGEEEKPKEREGEKLTGGKPTASVADGGGLTA